MVAVTERGDRVSTAAVQLAGWHDAAAFLERCAREFRRDGDKDLAATLRMIAAEVRVTGEEQLAPTAALERDLIAAAA